KPYQHKTKDPKPKVRKEDKPKTSAKPVASGRKPQLTLADWLLVYAWVDDHPAVTLEFTQSTLSRKLANRPEMEKRVESNPNALSGKRERVVTSPEVERALFLWVKSMEAKGN
ncbi:hypothetical protein FB451DRAFT_966441, partial [Mycena latifolia]